MQVEIEIERDIDGEAVPLIVDVSVDDEGCIDPNAVVVCDADTHSTTHQGMDVTLDRHELRLVQPAIERAERECRAERADWRLLQRAEWERCCHE